MPKHAKPRKHVARTVITLAATLAVTGLAGAGLAELGTTPANAATITRPVNWPARTCQAFANWNKHHTTTRLDAVLTDSEHVAWKYLGEDADDLYRAARQGKSTDTAVQYFYADCNNGSGL